MSTNILGHQLSVSSVPFSKTTDTVLNVKKRRETVVYSGKTDLDNINLAYADTQPISSTNNLFLSDKGTKLVANRVIDTDPVSFTGASYALDVDTFLLTDVFTDSTPTQTAIPLFFQHVISRDYYDPDDSTHFLTQIELLDRHLKPLKNLTEILITTADIKDEAHGVIYNNLENTFNESGGTYKVYYVKYTIRQGSQFTTYLELLNNCTVYRSADPDDVDSGGLIATRRTYVVTETSAGFDIEISRSALHSIVQLVEARIKVKKPTAQGPTKNWFLSVTNGKFFASLPGKGVLKYEIAEFSSQIFNPYYPYKTISQEQPVQLTDMLFKLAKDNIQIDANSGFDLVVEVYDQGGSLVDAYTTNSDDIGTNFVPSVPFTDGIRSVDQRSGFLALDEKLSTGYSILVSYIFEEKEYEFIDVDFNPIFNANALDETIALYIKPQSSSSLSETLFYLRVDVDGNVLYSSQAEAEGMGPVYNAVNSGITYSQFVDDFTIEGDTTEMNNGALLVIAEGYTGEAMSVDEILLTDIRIRGGGIKEFSRAQILDKNFESIWNWDIGSWDGYPYPGTASYFVEVPCAILDTNGGFLSRNEIKSIVDEHTALGIYPITKVYGDSPVVTGVSINMADVTLDWTYHGPDFSYNVYASTAVEGPFELLNPSPLSSISYTTSGLDRGTNYWFLVTALDAEDHECTDSDDAHILALQTW